MKNLKNSIAIIALVSILGIGNSFGATTSAEGKSVNQQYSETAGTWLDGLLSYFNIYIKSSNPSIASSSQTAKSDKLAANHNETLLRDEL